MRGHQLLTNKQLAALRDVVMDRTYNITHRMLRLLRKKKLVRQGCTEITEKGRAQLHLNMGR
jgi:hypothetical protein